MGPCASLPKKREHEPLPFVNQDGIKEMPSVIILENFKIFDYSQTLKNVKEISEVRYYFQSYKPTDVRCVKGRNEGGQDHSHLIISFTQVINKEAIKEIGLITDYSPYGFAVSIGEMKQVKDVCNLNNCVLELLHLPKADNQGKLSVSDAIEWAFEHRDEQYMNPKDTPEFNMGKRMFQFIASTLSEKKFIVVN